MIHIKEMASDDITEDEMTQRFEKVENQNADCKFQSHFVFIAFIVIYRNAAVYLANRTIHCLMHCIAALDRI